MSYKTHPVLQVLLQAPSARPLTFSRLPKAGVREVLTKGSRLLRLLRGFAGQARLLLRFAFLFSISPGEAGILPAPNNTRALPQQTPPLPARNIARIQHRF